MRSLLTCALVTFLAAVSEGKMTRFGPLDPDNTNPAEFWMPLYNEIPQDYCEAPRYPVVPTTGGIAMKVLHEVYPNGTVPNVTAKPTNTWQKNLWGYDWNNLGDWSAVYPYPYVVQPKASLIQLMYPGAPIGQFGNRAMSQAFVKPGEVSPGHPEIRNASYPYITMAASFDIGVQIYNGNNPRLINLTETGATIEYRDGNDGNRTVATLYLVKGSPFVNIECDGCQLGFGDSESPPIIQVDNLPPGQTVTGTHFRFTTAAGPVHKAGTYWHAYFNSTVSLDVPNPPNKPINATGPFSGLVQVACGEIDDKAGKWLNKINGVFAKRAHMTYDVNPNNASVIFNYELGGDVTLPLTMLAIPHHMDLMPNKTMSTPSPYWSIKGNMTAVTGSTWRTTYNLTSVGFGDQLKVDPAMKPALLKAVKEDYKLRIDSCPGDNATKGYPGYMNMELYAYVRDLSQYTDIAIILHNLGEFNMSKNMTEKVMFCMAPVLKMPAKAPHPCPPPINGTATCVRDQQDVYFDTHWGGLVTNWFNRFAAHYCQCDKPGGPDACKGLNYCDNPRGWSAFSNYGNPFYNDHHFQYGYVVKNLAWWVYAQKTLNVDLGMNATVLRNVTKKALAFARDIANPDGSKDNFFAFTRHKDIYDGHSWAEGYDYSGRILTWVNQQSGGEAINGYYGVYLLGMALNDTNVRDWGRIQLATESFSIQRYQHLSNTTEEKAEYPTKEINKWGKCLSILMGNGASGATYYGPNALFQCGITMLPISPYTREWLNEDWAKEAVEWMRWQVNSTGLCVFYDPLTMDKNPCPGWNHSDTWTGNEWACCPTNVGYPHNQWRAYPDWMPYLYMVQSQYNATDAWSNLQYTDIFSPTKAQPFPYLKHPQQKKGGGKSDAQLDQYDIVGYQADITRSAALFHVATHGRQTPKP